MDKLGRYQTIKKIGSGGMAEVFLAKSRWAQGIEKLLVIKKIHPVLASNKRFIDMFVDEASVAMRLNHVNIVQVYTFEQIQDDYFLVMEYVDGFDLHNLMTIVRAAGRSIPPGLAAFIAAEAAKGLDYAHSRKDDHGNPLDIVHRDVSPQNILISSEGEVKVTDFGVARARWLHEEAEGTIKGKLGYMAPEQAMGRAVDRRSDVYSLGVVLYEMLVGEPHKDVSKADDIFTNSIPSPLLTLVKKAVRKNPSERHQTTREIATDLGHYLHKEREIYDGDALRRWILSIMPASDSLGVERAQSKESSFDTLAKTDVFMKSISEVPQGSYSRLGVEEQRISVVVRGVIDVANVKEKENILKDIFRLVDEMAFKAGGIVGRGASEFTVFLGTLDSSNEDSISGIRLAHDALDAIRAVSEDGQVEVKAKLAITLGFIRFEQPEKSAEPRLNPEKEIQDRTNWLLESIGFGRIAADSRIFRLARREYNFEKTEDDRALKPDLEGRYYLVTSAKSREEKALDGLENTSFYGREKELSLLFEALRSAEKGEVTLRLVQGEMGIGKSRIIERFVKTLPPDSVNVFSTECLFAERDSSLSSVSVATLALLDIVESDPLGRISKKLMRLLEGTSLYSHRQAIFFEEFLKSPEAIWNKHKHRRREIIRRISGGLGVLISVMAKERPVVLIVENAHWLDGPSVDVLCELANERAQAKVLIIFVGQPRTLKGRRVDGLEKIEIQGLPDDLMEKIIMERLGFSESMEALARQVVSRVQGNPFFAYEIIDSLVEQNIIASDENSLSPSFRQIRPGIIKLPTTMEGIAASRLNALSPEQRIVLRTAAAMGADFTIAALSAIIGQDIEAEVLFLTEQSILAAIGDDRGGVRRYRFRQPMMRVAAYESLSEKDRTRIHSIMARQLIEEKEQGKAVPTVRIAWHLDHAGETEQAGKYYLDAGNAALEFYSSREALKLYDRALRRLQRDSLDRFLALERRDRVLRDLLRHRERQRDLKEMERIADARRDDALMALVITKQAQFDYDTGDFTAAARKLGRSLELAVRTSSTSQQIEALRLLAYVAVEEGHLVRGLDCCNRALALIEDGSEDLSYLMSRALGIKGFVLLNMGDLDAAAGPLAKALVLFRRLRKRRNESQVMSNLALLAQARGELTEAVDFLRSAIRIDIEIRDASARGAKLAALGSIKVELGDFEGAEANFNDSVAISRGNKENLGAIDAELGITELLMERGQYSRAKKVLEGVSRNELLTRSRLLFVRYRQLAALVLAQSGMQALARRLAEEAARVSLEAGMTGEAIRSGVIQGFILAKIGMTSEALLATRRAMDLLSSLGKLRRAEEAWWLHATTLHMANDSYRAKKALEFARKEVERKRALISDPNYVQMYDKHPLTAAITKGFE